MRRVRLHDPAGYMLALAGVSLLAGFGLMGYEGTRFGDHADPWHHFWFCFGVGFLGVAAVLVLISMGLFIRDVRHGDDQDEQELASHTRLQLAPHTAYETWQKDGRTILQPIDEPPEPNKG